MLVQFYSGEELLTGLVIPLINDDSAMLSSQPFIMDQCDFNTFIPTNFIYSPNYEKVSDKKNFISNQLILIIRILQQ